MKTIKTRIAGIVAVWLICILPFLLYGAQEVELTDEFGNRAGRVDVKKLFREVRFPDVDVLTDPDGLLRQMEAVAEYFQNYKKEDGGVVSAGIFSQLGITFSDVEATLRFAGKVMAEDLKKGKGFRLRDGRFLREHFRVFRWYPYGGKSDDTLRLTKYAVFTVKGHYKKTAVYNCALYGLPWDEKGMSLAEAEKHKQRLSRFRYTKQQVLGGVYDKGGASPLVWVSRGGLEEALLEGSICVALGDGKTKYFNVDRNNGMAYNRSVKNGRDQRRYWYFGEVSQPRGYGRDIQSQVRIYPGVVFAGDVYNLGLGKLLGVVYRDVKDGKRKMMLGVLADTGGAFTPNLHQLDYYAGIFPSREAFKRSIARLPSHAAIYIIIYSQS